MFVTGIFTSLCGNFFYSLPVLLLLTKLNIAVLVEMADLSRSKKSRSAQKNVLQGLAVKAQNYVKEGPGEGSIDDINATLKMIKKKLSVIADLNEKILEKIDENELETDVEESTLFEMKIEKSLTEIEEITKRRFYTKVDDVEPGVENTSFVAPHNKIGVKLPKIVMKKFFGEPVLWQQFQETFEATVHNNTSLSDIEKFSYLKEEEPQKNV